MKHATDTNMLDVQLLPHPFAAERVHRRLAAGGSIAEIVAALNIDPLAHPHLHAFIDGHAVPRENWARVMPKAGTVLTLRMVPMGGGGGGKNPLRTVLSLALMAASPVLSAGLAGALGSFGGIPLVGRLLTTGVSLLGRLALNALAPPGRARYSAQKESQTLFIQGAQNRATPFGRVPKILGRHRFVPPFGALPYTETAGNDQYLRMLFVWGYGPLHISDLKIGETPLSEFEDVEIETRQGYADDAPLTLYTNSVLQNDLAVTLKQADGYVLRTSEADADEISVDITLPRGLATFASSGARRAATVQVEVQYAPAGTESWSAAAGEYKAFAARSLLLPPPPFTFYVLSATSHVTRLDLVLTDAASGALSVVTGTEFREGIDTGTVTAPLVPAGKIMLANLPRSSAETWPVAVTDSRDANLFGLQFDAAGDFAVTASVTANQLTIAAGGLRFPGIAITGKQTAALRQTVSFKVPRGRYDVRLRRLTADAADDNRTFDDTVWTALRSLRYTAPVTMPGLAMTALRIKATDQLSGVIDRFNGVVTSILPDWNGSGWVEQQTANPAALFRHTLQGSANARPLDDSRLNLPRLEQWHENCAAASREFNAVIDYDVSVREVLQNIAAAGRASPALLDGKWLAVEDRPQDVPVQHFTPRNTWGFEGRKSFSEVPEALRLRFLNRDKGWQQDECLVYADDKDAASVQRYETLDLAGITSSDQAWRDGRYHMATAQLRPETYSFNCDIENIICTRGDLVRFTHDVPLFGLSSARVASLKTGGDTVSGVTLDAAAEMQAGKRYAARFRKADGTTLVAPLLTSEGKTKTLLFASALAATQAPEIGDLAMFGESGLESVELVVQSIVPSGNLSARLSCVDAAPAIHVADEGNIPPFNSQITAPPALQRPPTPVLDRIQSGEETLIRNTDGSLTTRIVVTLLPPANAQNLTPRVLLRAQDETQFHPAETSLAQNRISISDVAEGESYDIDIRYVSQTGMVSAPLLIAAHRVAGTSALPSDITNFSITVLGDTAHLSWTANADLDLDHYALRFTPQLDETSWSGAVDIVASIARDATSLAVPLAGGSYLLKAVDVGGRFSANAAVAVTPVNPASSNAVLEIDESHFTGTKIDTGYREGALQLGGRDSVDDWENFDTIPDIDIGLQGLAASGSYLFAETADLGAVYTSRLTASLSATGIDLNETIDSVDNIDALEVFDQDADPSNWSLQLQLRMTSDDPDAAPVWSSWSNFVIGDYTARAFQFRVLMAAESANISPALAGLTIQIDMPDRMISGRAVASGAAPLAITFERPFRAIPALTITPYDMASGDYYRLSSQSDAGFTLGFYASSGAGISRTFDYQAHGYGERR